MKLLILDGNSVINRAYFGVKPLTNREGLYTHAIYGFLNILERMEKEEQPDAICVAFDLHGPTFRHLKYDGYKATRHGMPEELAMQMPVMKDVLRAMNIPIYECQGWEADDVIGFPALTFVDRNVHSPEDILHHRHLHGQFLGHAVAVGLVTIIFQMAESRTMKVKGNRNGFRLFLLLHLFQNVQKAIDGMGVKPLTRGKGLYAKIGSIDNGISIQDQ